MTEADWLAASDPQGMLTFLRGTGVATDRKLRLFSAACCRRLWHLLTRHSAQRVVEVAELLADGGTSHEDLAKAWQYVIAPDGFAASGWAAWLVAGLVVMPPGSPAVAASAARLALQASNDTSAARTAPPGREIEAARAAWAAAVKAGDDERGAQACMLRDLLGPFPFRPVSLPPSLRAWKDGLLVSLAQSAYEHRLFFGHLDPARLAVLADALDEAGCTDAALVSHLRAPGPHVRGCWALDAVLGLS